MIIGIIIIIGLFFLSLCIIHPFLAVSNPIHSDILVIEGWISEEAVRHAAAIFAKEKYKRGVILTGTGKEGETKKICLPLFEDGNNSSLISFIPVLDVKAHKTYMSALTLREWIKKNIPALTSFNLFTETVHARKSHIIFKKAFNPHIKVGIIAGKTNKYNVDFWFLSPQGVRLVFKSLAGVLYALFVSEKDVLQSYDYKKQDF